MQTATGSRLVFFAALISLCVACNSRHVTQKNPTEESVATVNLRTVTNSDQFEVFHEVKQASRLPGVVLEKIGGIADPGQPYNATDVVDPKLPVRRLIVGALSENYCIVSYWHGGIALGLETSVYELSDGKVKRIWWSRGGGLNFRDLKNTVESDNLLQFKQVFSAQ